jgi:DNA-directed RNA polymerase specialized sigma24 family protein
LEAKKLNSLVERYREGDEVALDSLCKTFLPWIQSHSESIWYEVEKQTEFECRCLLKIKRALERFDPKKGNVSSLIISVIKREKNDFLKRRKRKLNVSSLDEPIKQKDGSETFIEVPDVLADVENKIIEDESIKEKVALLAKGDQRKMVILKAWIDGEFNDTKLAKDLANLFPDVKESGHRRTIQRFREECKRRLATA